jgi:hypothetical protein
MSTLPVSEALESPENLPFVVPSRTNEIRIVIKHEYRNKFSHGHTC